jgi:hypothetical protein
MVISIVTRSGSSCDTAQQRRYHSLLHPLFRALSERERPSRGFS